jgi:Protein of unknown function (DUF3592)
VLSKWLATRTFSWTAGAFAVLAGLALALLLADSNQVFVGYAGAVDGQLLGDPTCKPDTLQVRFKQLDGFRLQLKYQAQVDGRIYTGNQLGRATRFMTLSECEAIAKSYHDGQTVTVWHDDSQPPSMVLDRKRNWTFLAVPLLSVLFGVILLVAFPTRRQRRRNDA